MKRPAIAVAACGCQGPRILAEELADAARELGASLNLGGCWGLMGAVVEEALKRGVEVTVFLPEGAMCDYDVKIVRTGSVPNMRSVLLVKSSDGLLALGGGAGTVMEVFMAYRERIPVAMVIGHGMDSDKFFNLIKTHGIDSRSLAPLFVTESPREALKWLLKMI